MYFDEKNKVLILFKNQSVYEVYPQDYKTTDVELLLYLWSSGQVRDEKGSPFSSPLITATVQHAGDT